MRKEHYKNQYANKFEKLYMRHEFTKKHKMLKLVKKKMRKLNNLINIRETGIIYRSIQAQAILKVYFTRISRVSTDILHK